MPIIKLDSVVIECAGQVEKFLNGLTSNTLDKPANAFLNLHGRIIATVYQLNMGSDRFLLVVTQSAKQALLNHVERYAKLNKTQITETAHHVYFDSLTQAPQSLSDRVIPLPVGQLVLSLNHYPDTMSQAEFTLFRLEHRIPLMGVDYKADDMILNVDEHQFVSYTKGCFLGQEPVAKVHHRSKPSWRLVVKYADMCTQEERGKMTSLIEEPTTKRLKGFVFVKNIE